MIQTGSHEEWHRPDCDDKENPGFDVLLLRLQTDVLPLKAGEMNMVSRHGAAFSEALSSLHWDP